MRPDCIQPKFYYSNHASGESDAKWINKMMSFIPGDKKREVSDRYDQIYRASPPHDREVANRYLHGEAKRYLT